MCSFMEDFTCPACAWGPAKRKRLSSNLMRPASHFQNWRPEIQALVCWVVAMELKERHETAASSPLLQAPPAPACQRPSARWLHIALAVLLGAVIGGLVVEHWKSPTTPAPAALDPVAVALGHPMKRAFFAISEDILFVNHGSYGAGPLPVLQVPSSSLFLSLDKPLSLSYLQ